MKKLLLLAVVGMCISFVSEKKFSSDKIVAPPGTVQLVDSLFIDKWEVSNTAWKEFVYYILDQKNDPELYKKMLPDTTVWRTLLFNNSVYVDFYFRRPEYNAFPVVGVSYEQAVAFCEWRTERVNELLKKMPKPPFREVLYRLPTKKEWEMAAAGKLEEEKFPFGYENIEYKSHGSVYKNFNCLYQQVDSTGNLVTNVMPVSSSLPNKAGLYNMVGNVAEMVAEKGIAKGGHYNLFIDDCKIKKDQLYAAPQCWLGFRCVCIIVEKNEPIEKESKKKHKA